MNLEPLRGFSLIVTGVDGFVGRHVARIAATAGAIVHGISRASVADTELRASLTDYDSIDLCEQWPERLQADAVIHLAGRAAVGPSFNDPQAYINDNSAMVTSMCEALLRSSKPPRIVGISTGAVYPPPPNALTSTDELTPVSPSSPYAVSKVLVEHQLHYYALRGLSTVIARPFNHIGPGQGPGFLLPDLITLLRTTPEGEPMSVGMLDTMRDYTDVRDVATAYLLLAAAPALGHRIYNVARGTSVSGRQLVELAAQAIGRDLPPMIVDHRRVRPTDPVRITGSARRLREELGWAPAYSLEESVADAVAASG